MSTGRTALLSRPPWRAALLLTIGDAFASAFAISGRLADAILDRIVHNAHRIELSSRESMRKERAALKDGGQSGK